MFREQERHHRGHCLHIGKKIRMPTEHRHQGHEVIARAHVAHEQIHRSQPLALPRCHRGAASVEPIYPPALHLPAWNRTEVHDAFPRDWPGATVFTRAIDWERADKWSSHHALFQLIRILDRTVREDDRGLAQILAIVKHPVLYAIQIERSISVL